MINKTSVFALIFFCNLFALDDVTKPFTFVARDTIKATKLNANWDTLYSAYNNLNDSLNSKFFRASAMHDSTWDTVKANYIRSNPDIDSINGLNILRGNPDIDSISGLNSIKGNPIFDSIQGLDIIRGNPDIDSIKGLNVLRGNPDIDSISGLNVMRGNPNIDSISGNTVFKNRILIKDSSLNTESFKVEQSRNDHYLFRIFENSDGHCDTYLYDSSNNIGISLRADAPSYFNHKLGIGTSSPGCSLTVKGNFSDTGDATITGILTVDSIQLTTGHYLNTYIDTTFPCSLYIATTLKGTANLSICQIGRSITMKIPGPNGLTDTISAGSASRISGIPTKFIPTDDMYLPVMICNAGTIEIGYLDSLKTIKTSAGADLSVGFSGLAAQVIRWFK